MPDGEGAALFDPDEDPIWEYEDSENGIEITAVGAKIMASEKVSTGEYENAQVSQTLEVSIEGVDLSEGIPKDLQRRLWAIKRVMQRNVEKAGEERREVDPIKDAETRR